MSGALGLMIAAGADNAFVIVGTAYDTTGAGGDPVVTKPAGIAPGDLLLAAMAATLDVTWTQPAGWTEVVDQGSRPSLAVARKIAGGSEPADYNFVNSVGAGDEGAGIVAIRGASFDVAGALDTSSRGDAIVAPSITLSKSGALVAIFACEEECDFSTPSGMLPVLAVRRSHGPSFAVFSQQLGAGATGSRTSTPSTGGNSAGILIGLKGA